MKLITRLRRLFGQKFYSQYTSIGIAWSHLKIILNSVGREGEWLKLDQLKSRKKSDTLFILGTGSSVNRYQPEQWEEIAHADSLGLNDWIFHDFVPDILLAEIQHDFDYFPQKYYQDLELVLDRYIRHNSVMIYKDGSRGKRNFSKLPERVCKSFRVLFNPTIPILKVSQIERAMQIVRKLLSNHDHNQKLIVYRKRATLFTAIELAWVLGYKKIILCGIDLNHTQYFFEENRDYYEAQGFLLPVYQQHIGGHKTNNSKISEVTVSELVKGIDHHLLAPDGVLLEVGSRESALAEFLPYHWGEHS